MGRLSTLTVILIIGAWGAARESASSDDAVTSPATAARKPAPVPPIRYLEAGSRLFNSGNFELAAKYLAAAQMYRDQLQQDEQTMLDAYFRELSKVRASTAAGSTATDGAGPAKTAASPAMTPAAVQAGPAKTAASPAMTPAAVQAAPAMTPASPAMTPAAVQPAPAMTPASPAMTPAAVQPAPAMTPAAVQAAPAMTPAAVQAAPAMTPASPAMTPAAVQAAPATTSVIQSGDPARGGAGDVAITPEVKQHAVWLLHEAREQMAQGNFDAAEKKIAEAEAIDIKWGLFDDTPTKVRSDLNNERPKNLASMSKPAQSLPHNRENAHALLREARAALASHQIDQAEAIAQEVKSWNLSYSFFGENPDKVAAAARALRKRDKIRNTPTRERASQGVYDVLVQESRQLMKLGKLNEAEAKALQAQRMNVVPALTADRAESVLHDIAMARVRSGSGSPAATPAAEPPSLVAEHEANDLLDKGDQAKAAAKYVESEKLRDKESGQAAIGQALATAAPAVDASIQKSPGAEPATEPLPAAPGAAGSPTPDKPAAPAPDSQPKPEPPAQGDALAAPGAAGSPTPDKPAAPALDSQPKPEPPGQGDALAAPARLVRRPLISLPLLPSTASPSLNRLDRAMRWRHPARLVRRPLISLPLLPSTASPSLNRLPRAMRWRHPARLVRRPLISPPLLPSTASPSLNRLDRAMRWRHPARLVRRPLISLPLLPSTASPSLNRLDRAMRWRHPARLDRRPLISPPLLPSTASPSLNRLPRAMRWRHPARLVRRPLISPPLLPSTASPSLNRLARAMRWRHPARLVRRPLISLPLLPSTASPSLNRLDRAMRWRHPARLVRRPLISLPLLPSTASPSLNRLDRAMRWRHPARLVRRPLISLPLLLPTARASRLSRCPIIARTPAPCSVRRVPPWQITRSIRRRPSRRRSRAGT